jgi:Thiamine monophosphate synthase
MASAERPEPQLFALTMGGPALAARVRAALDAGARVLVRELSLPDTLFPGVILHARMPGAEEEARRLGLGLHLASDMDVAAVRRRFSGELGASTHSVDEARAARDAGADHVFLSPIWPPSSKPGRPTLGIGVVGGVVALGGITPERAEACIAAGAVGVAVMGGIFGRVGEEGEATLTYRTRMGLSPRDPRSR